MEPAQPIPQLPAIVDVQGLVDADAQLAILYTDLAVRHNALVAWVKKFTKGQK